MPKSAFLKVHFDTPGLKALMEVVHQLPIEVRTNVLADGVRMGAKPVVTAAKSFAAVRSGALRKSITSVVRKDRKRGTAVAVVGPSTQYFHGGKKVKKGQSYKGADRPANYAHLVEFGYAKRNGAEHPARPFMRPAVRVAQAKVGVSMAVGIQRGLTKAIRKFKRKK
jgi:HK97 gp10 family phage protein